MTFTHSHEHIVRMADGTIKQFNPFSQTEVWTVPGRANRPLAAQSTEAKTITDEGHTCIFCSERVRETPPEKSRVARNGDEYTITDSTSVDILASPWEFRRIPNLFEIVSYSYWKENYGFEMSREARARMESYITDPAGKAHILDVLDNRYDSVDDFKDERARLKNAESFFGGSHDVIVARRHYVDGAHTTDQLAGAATLTPEEHSWYMALTIEAMHDLYRNNRYATYVQVFQNWRKAAGASIDHLHKQLVAIDERPIWARSEAPLLHANPNIYNEHIINYAERHNLVVAENDHTVAIAGFGHRYPTLEVWSRSRASQPWEHSDDERRAMSDLVHAMHAATGTQIATNEEWYCAPIDLDVPMPWRILIKWRVSTLAGFEGGSKIYVNTIDPFTLRDRVVPKLLELRAEGTIASDIRIATECSEVVNSLHYNPNLWR